MNKKIQYDADKEEYFIDVGGMRAEEIFSVLEEIKEKLENKEETLDKESK